MNDQRHFLVPLNPTEHDEELYRAADENVIQIEVQSPSGEMINSSSYKVVISVSKDAMLGLGASLIRAAVDQRQKRTCWEFENAESGSAVEELGVYLHPKSCKLIVNLTSLGKLETILERQTE